MQVLKHDLKNKMNGCECSECHDLMVLKWVQYTSDVPNFFGRYVLFY